LRGEAGEQFERGPVFRPDRAVERLEVPGQVAGQAEAGEPGLRVARLAIQVAGDFR